MRKSEALCAEELQTLGRIPAGVEGAAAGDAARAVEREVGRAHHHARPRAGRPREERDAAEGRG